MSITPPEVWIRTTPTPMGYADIHELQGWEELNNWAIPNHPLWSHIQRRLHWEEGMSEVDKLRLLASELLRENIELRQAKLDEVLKSPHRILLPIHDT